MSHLQGQEEAKLIHSYTVADHQMLLISRLTLATTLILAPGKRAMSSQAEKAT